MVMEDLSEKVIRDLGRGNSKRKGPEAGVGLAVFEESKEASVAGTERRGNGERIRGCGRMRLYRICKLLCERWPFLGKRRTTNGF